MPKSRPEAKTKIGYVLRKFPVLSETFVLNELLAIERGGTRLEVFSLMPPRDPRYHEGVSRLKASIRYVPGAGDLRSLRPYNRGAIKSFGSHYSRVLAGVLATGRPTLLWRFLQAAYVAERAARVGITHFHAHFATRATNVTYLASRLSGIPYSFTAHAVDIYKAKVQPRVLTRKIRDARFVVTVSEYNKKFLADFANGSQDKIVRIYNGIDLDRFQSNGVVPFAPLTILSVARFVEKKGLHILIDACRHLRDAGEDFRCLIIGKGQQRGRLKSLIQQWQLGDHVSLLGPHTQGEIVKRYQEANLFVLPCIIAEDGNRDGLPVAIVEALACGLPVVTTPVTGIPEVVRDGENGLLVPMGDAPALAKAIRTLVHDPGRYERLRLNARASVAEDFDLENTGRRLRGMLHGGPP